MTDQQQHLKELLQKREELQKEVESLQVQMTMKRDAFIKIQGIIEYLTQIGVTVPTENIDTQNESV